MGPGVPYAIAAKFAYPNRVVIALVGDGAMQMNGINGLISIAEHWREWADPRLIVMVLNNGDLNQVTWEQRVMEGDPKFSASQDVPRFAYAEYANLLGLTGIRVDKPDDIAEAWSRAFASDRPVLLEMVTDPNVPPLPPHVSMKNARNYLAALLHRDPDAIALIKATMKETWAGR
jgi:pyruvate dehydrogenase (quinone)